MNVLEVKPQYIGTMLLPFGVNIISPIIYSALLSIIELFPYHTRSYDTAVRNSVRTTSHVL